MPPAQVLDHPAIPDDAEAALARLYGNVFSSLALMDVYGWQRAGARAFEIRRDGCLDTLLLYQSQLDRVRVLNEGIRLDEARINRFAEHIFAHDSRAEAIHFHAIETDFQTSSFHYQRHNVLEDFTLALPGDGATYFAGLGKATRRNIRRYGNKLARDFAAARIDTYDNDAIPAGLIAEIVRFNHERMARQGKVSDIDAEETGRILALARRSGLATSITIDGNLAAGAVCWRAGDNFFVATLAHDPNFDAYRLGFLCSYHTVLACIERGGANLHLLWGRYDDKYLLGATPRDLDSLVIYRTPWHALRHAGLYARIHLNGYARRARLWVKYADHPLAQQIRRAMPFLVAGRRVSRATRKTVPMIGSLTLNVLSTAEP